MKTNTHEITEQVKAVCAEWDAQPTRISLILSAKREAAKLKTLEQLCAERGVDYRAAKKWIYWTTH